MREINNPINIDKWFGLYTLKGSHLIGDYFLANSKNISVSDGSISPFKIYSLFANRLSTAGRIVNSYTTVRADSVEIPLRVREDDSNTHIEWYNSINKKWETLLPNLTTGKIPTFADFNTSTQDEVWWCNGTENMTKWIKIIGSVASNTSTVITLNETIATAGFPSSGTVIVDGVEYTYSGVGTYTLTGLTGLPTFDADAGVALAADDSTYSGLTKYNILLTADGRMWGASSTGVTLAYSKVGDATNWTASTLPGDPGSIDLVEGEGGFTDLKAINENIICFKKDLVAVYKLSYPSATTRTEQLLEVRRGDSVGCVNKLASVKIGEEIYYATANGGIKSVSLSKLYDGFSFDDVTENIRPSLKNGVFTSCAMSYNEKNKVILASYKKDSDSSQNDMVIVIEKVRTDENQIYNALGILDWNVNCWFKYSGDMYFGDSLQSNTFKAFDGYSKDGGPFLSLATTKRYRFGDLINQKEIRYLIIFGWISSGTKLNFELDYDYMGTRAHLSSSLSGTEKDYIIEPSFNTIGSFELGTEPIGGTLDDIDELNYFRVFFTLPTEHKPFDIQLTIYTDVEGARYKIENIVFDVALSGNAVPDNLKKSFS